MEQEKQYKTWDGKDWDGNIFREDQKQYTVYIPKYNLTVKTGLTDAREIMYQTDIKALKQSRDMYFALGRLGEPKRDFSESIFKQAAKATGNFVVRQSANLYGWGKDWLWKGWNEHKKGSAERQKFTELLNKEYQPSYTYEPLKNVQERYNAAIETVKNSEEYKQFLKENEQKFAEAEKAREEWNIRQRKDLDDFIQKSGLDKNHFDGFTYDLVGGGASAVAALAVGAITKSPAAVTAVFGASAGHDYYTEALAAGLTGNKAMAVGYGAGALEGFFERFGAEGLYRAATNAKLFKHSINAIIRNARIKLRKQGLKKLGLDMGTAALEGAAVEGSEEFVQDISTAAIMNAAGVRNDEARQIIIDGLYSAALGAVTGSAMAGGGKIGVTTLAYMQKQSIANKLEQVGFNKENAEEIAAEIIDKGYSRETTEEFIKFAESENSKVTYPNGDKEAAAKRFGEQVKELADPAKRAAAAKEMWAIYDKVKEDALAAGLPQMWADFAAKQAEIVTAWVFKSVGMMPKEWYEKNKITFLNDMKTDWEKRGRPEKFGYKTGQMPIDQSLIRQVLDGNGESGRDNGLEHSGMTDNRNGEQQKQPAGQARAEDIIYQVQQGNNNFEDKEAKPDMPAEINRIKTKAEKLGASVTDEEAEKMAAKSAKEKAFNKFKEEPLSNLKDGEVNFEIDDKAVSSKTGQIQSAKIKTETDTRVGRMVTITFTNARKSKSGNIGNKSDITFNGALEDFIEVDDSWKDVLPKEKAYKISVNKIQINEKGVVVFFNIYIDGTHTKDGKEVFIPHQAAAGLPKGRFIAFVEAIIQKQKEQEQAQQAKKEDDELRLEGEKFFQFGGPKAENADTLALGKAKEQLNSDGRQIAHTPQNIANFWNWFGKSKVVDKNGRPLVVYHGTQRTDRVGSVFLPERATSGPMAMFTDNKDIAQGYADKKEDTSLNREDTSYKTWYKIKVNGKFYDIEQAWNALSSKKQQEISKKAKHITQDDNGNIIYDKNETQGNGGLSSYTINNNKGNMLKALCEVWLEDGALYDEEEKFGEVLKLAGFKEDDFEYNSPYMKKPGVYDVYLSIQKPLDTSNIPSGVIAKLEQAAQKAGKATTQTGADIWDKNNKDPQEWIKQLKEDYDANKNSYVWTSIPDWVTEVLKTEGYDGIKDIGNKSGNGTQHTVWIPFYSNQIKSVNNNGGFDRKNDNIFFQRAYAGSPAKFDKFSLSAIGSGEGVQVHGWGLYFAKDRDVAKSYKEKLSKPLNRPYNYDITLNGEQLDRNDRRYIELNFLAVWWRNDKNTPLKQVYEDFKGFVQNSDYNPSNKERYEQKLKVLEGIDFDKVQIETVTPGVTGQLSEVEIPEDDVLLDEQKSFGEQPKKVQEGILALSEDYEVLSQLTNQDNWGRITGREIYEKLSAELAVADGEIEQDERGAYTYNEDYYNRQTSILLNEYGIKGITYEGRQDGRCYVVFDDKAISLIERYDQRKADQQQDDKSEEDTRLQPSGMTEPAGARGYVEFSTQGAFMHLLENADPSTILHETSGHIQLRNFEKIRDIAETEGASQEFWDIWERVENWLGKAQRIENPDGTVNYRFTTEQQEMFAEGMEKMYIAGKAPTTTLQKVFEYFKQMLSEMYEEAREWLDLRPEVEELFGKILAGPQVEDADSKLYKGKAKDIKQVAEKARKGEAATINGLGIKEVKALIKQLSKRRPKMPKDDLFTVLKRKGADYEKAAGIDKEQYENAGIKNKQGGIDDKLALWLKREGFMEFDEDGSYEQDQELEQQAADMIDRALSGETIYRIADLDKVAQVENFDANMEAIREVFGNNVEQAEETLRAIEDLQVKGYRVIGNSDIEYAERETGKLMSFAEKERMLKAKIEELTKDKEELAEIAERRLIAIGRTQAQAKEEGYKEAIKDAQDEKTVKDLLTVEQEARKNALDAKRIKNALIDELNKRELEGKQEMLKELAAAKSTQDIFTAAQKLMTALHKQYEKTDSAKAEQRKTELPKTDWGRVKLSAIEKFKKIAQQADSDVQRARELDKQASAMRAKGQKPDEKQQAQFDNARGKILKGYGLKFAKAIKEAFYGVEHIDNIWLDKQANMLGAEYARGRNILGAELDRLIERAQKRQTENYKKYIAGKIQKMLEAGYKVKDGQKQKGKYDYATNKLFEDLNALAALDRTSAKKELERRQNIADRGLSDNEAALEVKGLNGDADNVIYAALADNMRLENMYLKFKAGKMNKEEMAAAKESLQAQGLPDNIGTDEWYYVSAQLLSQFYKEVNERRNAALEGRIAQSVLRAQEEEREREQFGEAVRKNGKAGLLKKGYLWWVANWESFINTVANGKFKDKFSLLEEEARAETRTNQKMTEVLQTVKKVLGADNTAVKKWVDSLDDKLITVKNRIESKRKALAESKGKIREKLTVLEQFRKLVSDNDDVVIKNLLSFQDEKGEYRDFNVRLVYDTEAGGLKRIYDGAGIDGVMRAVSVLEKGLLDKYSPTANKYKKDGVILLKNSNDFAAVLKYSERGGKGTYTLIDYIKWDKNGKQTEGYGIDGKRKSGGDTRQQHSGMTEKNNSELKQDETSATNTSPKEGITDVSNNNIPENYTDDSSDKELKREIKKAALAAAANTVNPWLDTIYAPVEQELTRGQIIDIYNTCKNDIGLTRYENQYGIDQLSQMFALLTPQEKQIADLWQKTVEGGYDEVNGVFVRQYGLDMGKPENYWPFSVDRIESKIDMLGSTYREASRPGLTKSRTKGTLVEMKPQNPVEKLYRHYQTAMKYVETAEKVAWLRRILRNSSIQKVMKENFGEDGVKVMYELLDNSTLGAGRNKAQYYADGIMNWLTNNYVKANIALKPSITLKQLISVVNYSENMPAAQWTKGFVEAVINWKDTIDFMMADPYLKARFENGSQNEALMRALAKDFGKNKTVKQLNSWSNILAFNVRLGDIGAIIFGGKPYIDYLMKEKGMSKEEAFKQFRLDTLRSQQASMRSSLSRLQAAEMNWLMRALFAFKNTNNQYVRKCMDAVISYKRGEISGKQLAKTLAIYAVINQYLYVAFGGLGLFAAAGAGFDDDDKNKQMWAEFMLWPAQNFGFLPIIDDAVSQASYKLSNLILEGKAGPVRNPEQPILKDIYTAVRTLQKDDISFEDVLNAFAPVAQTATGLPVNYGLNAGKAANELYKANLMKSAVMLGGWSEKRAQAVAGEE